MGYPYTQSINHASNRVFVEDLFIQISMDIYLDIMHLTQYIVKDLFVKISMGYPYTQSINHASNRVFVRDLIVQISMGYPYAQSINHASNRVFVRDLFAQISMEYGCLFRYQASNTVYCKRSICLDIYGVSVYTIDQSYF